jgi:hypothetical protein
MDACDPCLAKFAKPVIEEKTMNILQGVTLTFRSIATMVCLITIGLAVLPASVYAKPSRSTNIALTQNGQKLVAVNVDANSVTVFQVQGGGGSLRVLAESR